jgi:hypothetical protein
MKNVAAKQRKRTGKDPEIKLPCALARATKIQIHVEIIIVTYACNELLIL